MKRSTILQLGRMLLTLCLLSWLSTEVHGEGVILKSGNFQKELSFYAYEQDKTVSVGGDTWEISISQYQYDYFYWGCNASHSGFLNRSSWEDVTDAIQKVNSDYSKSKDDAYAMRLTSGLPLEGVEYIEFRWSDLSSGSTMEVYLFIDLGKGLELQGTKKVGEGAGSISCEFTSPQQVDGLVLVALPDENHKTMNLESYEIRGSAAVSRVADPVLEPGDGTTFDTDELTVKASCATAGAVIYYTTDGSEPTTASAPFPTEGLKLHETTTVKAVAAVADASLENSKTVTATYTKQYAYTFAWSKASCTVDLNDETYAYPTLTNTYPEGTVAYTSSRTSVATVDSETGEITLTGTGTTTITASIRYGGADVEASYELTVTGLSASEEEVAIVAQDDNGVYYAMLNTSKEGDRMDAEVVKVVNGKVLDEGRSAMRWIVDLSDGTIRDTQGRFLKHVENTTISLDTHTNRWDWDGTKWLSLEEKGRFLAYDQQYGYFRAYNTGLTVKAAAPMPITEGYVRDGLTAGHYGTICLPCAVKADDYEGAEFFTVAGAVKENEVVTSIVLEKVQELEAGTPYVFCATADELLVAYDGEAAETAGTNNGLVGSFEGMNVAEGMYLLTTDNEVKCLGEKGGHIGENRAYFDLSLMSEYVGETAGVNRRVIELDDATGVSAVEAEAEHPVDVFTLDGVKVRSQVSAGEATVGLPRGIYVVDKRKVAVEE